MILVGKQNCSRCENLKASFPFVKYIEIPDVQIGVGDTICDIACFFGIIPCESCRIRQLWLNRIFPYWWNARKISSDIKKLKHHLLRLKIKQYPILMDDDLCFILPMSILGEGDDTRQ